MRRCVFFSPFFVLQTVQFSDTSVLVDGMNDPFTALLAYLDLHIYSWYCTSANGRCAFECASLSFRNMVKRYNFLLISLLFVVNSAVSCSQSICQSLDAHLYLQKLSVSRAQSYTAVYFTNKRAISRRQQQSTIQHPISNMHIYHRRARENTRER